VTLAQARVNEARKLRRQRFRQRLRTLAAVAATSAVVTFLLIVVV